MILVANKKIELQKKVFGEQKKFKVSSLRLALIVSPRHNYKNKR